MSRKIVKPAQFTVNDPMYGYVERLLKNQQQLQVTLESMQQSWSWKFLAPLRWIDDFLRAQRRKRHLQKRAVTDHD